MEKYVPIDCNYYDRILEIITKKEVAELEFINLAGAKEFYLGRFLDVYTKAGEEFLKLENGATLRLDTIVSINRIARPINASCAVR